MNPPEFPAAFPRAATLALTAALVGLVLGLLALGIAWFLNAWTLAGMGLTALLQIPQGLHLRARIREGFGNRGLDREHRLGRLLSHLHRLGALGLALGGIAVLLNPVPATEILLRLGLAGLGLGSFLALWFGKRRCAEAHPLLTLDAQRAQLPLEAAGLLLAATALAHALPQADGVAVLLLAGRMFQQGSLLSKATNLAAACGGCGGGCGCR